VFNPPGFLKLSFSTAGQVSSPGGRKERGRNFLTDNPLAKDANPWLGGELIFCNSMRL